VKEILNKFSLTQEEKDFADKVAKDLGYNGDVQISAKAQVFATIHLSKQLEEYSKSNDKSSKAMNKLTGALVFFGACQLIISIISLVVKN
jgi:hypothetical protein